MSYFQEYTREKRTRASSGNGQAAQWPRSTRGLLPAAVERWPGKRGVEGLVGADGEDAGAGALGVHVELLAERPHGRQQTAAAVGGGVLAAADDAGDTCLAAAETALQVGTEVEEGLGHVEAVEVDDVCFEGRVVVAEEMLGGAGVVGGGGREEGAGLAGELGGCQLVAAAESGGGVGEHAVAALKGGGGALAEDVVGGRGRRGSWGSRGRRSAGGGRRRARGGRAGGGAVAAGADRWSVDELSVHGRSLDGAVFETLGRLSAGGGSPGKRRRPGKRFQCSSASVHALAGGAVALVAAEASWGASPSTTNPAPAETLSGNVGFSPPDRNGACAHEVRSSFGDRVGFFFMLFPCFPLEVVLT